MSATPAFVSPRVLRWARTRTGASIQDLAKRVNTKPERINAWEDGTTRPSLRQAEHLAGALHIPFGYLFLTDPPDEKLPIRDFRSVSDAVNETALPDLLDVVNDVLVKQQWYREFIVGEGRAALPFVGSFKPSDDPVAIAAAIRDVIQLNDELRSEARTWEDFLRLLTAKCEVAGVLVMRSGIVGSNPHRKLRVQDFRGFAISDRFAPVVFINGADARATQIFTLAHELAHVWLGESGVSDEQMDRFEVDGAVEALCNHVAAELLVPSAEVSWSRDLDINGNVRALSTRFKVSRLVALRRAFDLRHVNKSAFQREYGIYESQYREAEQDAEGGGNFYATLFPRNSPTFTRTVVSAVTEGKALYREAAQLLNIKVPTINKVVEYMEARAE